jgi:hypothetical protein
VHADRAVHRSVEPVDVVRPEGEDPAGPHASLVGTLGRGEVVSTSSPETTAPEDTSGSCQPVSLSGVQHSNQTFTWTSRCSET